MISQGGKPIALYSRKLTETQDGRVVGRDHQWVQDASMVTVAMLCTMVLDANLEKTRVMVCILKFIWNEWGKKSYKRRSTGEGASLGRGSGCG